MKEPKQSLIYLAMAKRGQKMERYKRSIHHVDREEACAVAASDCDRHGQAATWHTYLHFWTNEDKEQEKERLKQDSAETTKIAVTITSKMVVQKLHWT
jgi:hypothetical protein